MKKIVLVALLLLVMTLPALATTSTINYCSLTAPKAYRNQAGFINALMIIRIDGMDDYGATILYAEVQLRKDEAGNVIGYWNPSGEQIPLKWNDMDYHNYFTAIPKGGLTRGADWMSLFFSHLSSSRSEYGCTIVPAS